MGRRKTPVFRDGSKKQSNDDGKIKAIRTWDDIDHDSEDECNYYYLLSLGWDISPPPKKKLI